MADADEKSLRLLGGRITWLDTIRVQIAKDENSLIARIAAAENAVHREQ
jgi:hypothetical protein